MPQLPKKPSTHLLWAELACNDGTPYPEVWRSSRALKLGIVFEMIRRTVGNQPLTILSAFRTPEHNRKVGGARNSQHLQGRALDIRPPKGLKVIDFYHIIKQLATVTDIRGIGLYPTFVHVDIRPQAHMTYWRGFGVKDSL